MEKAVGMDDSMVTTDVMATYVGGVLPRTLENITGTPNTPSNICTSEDMPDTSSYFSALDQYGIILLTFGGLAVFIILVIYLDTLKYVMNHASSNIKTHTGFVISAYPVFAVATYCAIVVPRAHFLAEAVSQGMFMFTLYQLFCLYVDYCGGEVQLIRRVKHDSLDPKVAPCCCWPCCQLPLWSVNKRNVKTLRMLVLQLPVVHGLVYIILLVMWSEEQSLYQVGYTYLQPIMMTSMFLGIWALIMTVKMLRETLNDYFLAAKFINLKLVLILSQSQAQLSKVLVWTNALPCNPPITPAVYGNLIYNCVVLLEVTVLGFWARSLYKKSIPDLVVQPTDVQEVFSCPTIDYSERRQSELHTAPKINQDSIKKISNTFINIRL